MIKTTQWIDIALNNKTKTKVSNELNLSRQSVSAHFNQKLVEIRETNKYRELVLKYKKDAVQKMVLNMQEQAHVAFYYDNKEYIYEEYIFPKPVSAIIKSVKEIQSDLDNFSTYKALMSIGIKDIPIEVNKKLDNVFMQKPTVKEWLLNILSSKTSPCPKKKLEEKMELVGFTKKNFVSFVKNNTDEVLNLGDTICLKEVFFTKYADQTLVSKIIEAAEQACIESGVCKTDANWIDERISLKIDHNFTPYEIKAILCESGFFKRDKKLNLIYINQDCKLIYNNIDEMVEETLKNYDTPIALKDLHAELKKKGRSYSYTSLSSIVIQRRENIVSSDGYCWLNSSVNSKKLVKKLREMDGPKILEYLTEYTKKDIDLLAKDTGLKKDTITSIKYTKSIYRFFHILYLNSAALK